MSSKEKISNEKIKQAYNYVRNLAVTGRREMSLVEVEAIHENLRRCDAAIKEALGTPDLEPIERLADAEAAVGRAEADMEAS